MSEVAQRVEVAFNGATEPWPHFTATVGHPSTIERLFELGAGGWRCTFVAGGEKGYEVVDEAIDSDLEEILWEGAAALTEDPEAEALVKAGETWIPWQQADDPRAAGGQMFDSGGLHSRGKVMFDTRNMVLVERIETAIAEPTRNGEPQPEAVALTITGRINRPPDDALAAEAPAEQVSHLHMMSWEGAADLVVDLHSLASRSGFDFSSLVKAKWGEAEAKGLTRRAAP
jgi:hypothetical protein